MNSFLVQLGTITDFSSSISEVVLIFWLSCWLIYNRMISLMTSDLSCEQCLLM